MSAQALDERRAEYEAYLRSSTWQAKRQLALERAEHRCQVCSQPRNLHVHHRTYERFGGEERPADLTVLCSSCHDLFHRSKRGNPGKARKRREKKAKRKARNLEVNPPTVSPVYVSAEDRERFDKMRAAELERRRQDKAERAQRRQEIEQRRRETARSRDWRDERALPRKAA
jgi:hypothetical protein